jgi:RNA polymerase sigma-70 factor (ECF subfamily)
MRTDAELVEDFLAHDTAAFRLLIERYHDPLLGFLVRLTGSRQTAEDVFQDTFLQIHQSIESFDTSRSFRPWLFTIAANKGRDTLRKQKRRKAVSLNTPLNKDGSAEMVDLLQIDIPDVSAPLDAADLSAKVQTAIDTLYPRLREILLLAYFQKMTYAQIADAFEIPIGTVKSRLHAAVAAFAKAWHAQTEAADNREAATE